MIYANAQDEAYIQNTAGLASIGVKEEIAAAITSIVGAQITNPILRTTDGSDFRTVDEYELRYFLLYPKHAQQLQVQCFHQEELCQETFHILGAGGKLNNQHLRPQNHDIRQRARRGG